MHGIGNTAEALRAQQNNKRQKGNPLSELTNLPNGRPLVKDEVCSSSNPLTQGPATTSTIQSNAGSVMVGGVLLGIRSAVIPSPQSAFKRWP